MMSIAASSYNKPLSFLPYDLQLTGPSTRALSKGRRVLNSISYSSFYSLPFEFNNNHLLTHSRTNYQKNVTSVEFDCFGSLVLASLGTQVLCYDFEECLVNFDISIRNRTTITDTSYSTIPVYPVVSLNPTFVVTRAKWNPYSLSQVAICGNAQDRVLMFDLERSNTSSPLQTFEGKEQHGFYDISFVDCHSAEKRLIVAGSSSGRTCIWDMRHKPKNVKYLEHFSNRSNPSRIVSLFPSTAYGENCTNIWVCHENGMLRCWDIRFSSRYPILSLSIFDSSFYKPGYLESAVLHPTIPDLLGFQLQDCSVGAFDLSRKLSYQQKVLPQECNSLLMEKCVGRHVACWSSFTNDAILCFGTMCNNVSFTDFSSLSPSFQSLRGLNTSVPLDDMTLSAASHPFLPYFITGGSNGCISCLGIESNRLTENISECCY